MTMTVHLVNISLVKFLFINVIFLLCYFENIFASVIKCHDEIEEYQKHTSCYLDKNFYPLNYDKTQTLSFCFNPELSFQYFAISILNGTSSLELAQLDNGLTRNAQNKVSLTIKKSRNNHLSYYSVEIILNDKTTKSWHLLPEELENGKELELYMNGPWIGSREITIKDLFELTNCNPEDFPSVLTPTDHITFDSCKDDYPATENVLTTICYFHHLNKLITEKNLNWKICFKPSDSFQHLAITVVDPTSQLYHNFIVLAVKSVNINQLNEYNFAIKDFKPFVEIQNILFKKETNLQFLFYGDWEGSRDFSTEDNIYFTNCQHETATTQKQTHPSTMQPSFITTFMTDNPSYTDTMVTSELTTRDISTDSATEEDLMAIDVNRNDTSASDSRFQDPVFRLNIILLIAGALLLSLTVGGIICCLVVVLLRRQTRKAKKKAKQRQSSIPVLQLPKDFQKNRFSYFNVMTSYDMASNEISNDSGNEERQGYEDPDVIYNKVDFEVVSNQEGKSIKEVIIFPKLFKSNSTASRSPEERNEGELSTSTPDLTCQLKKIDSVK